MGVRCPLELFAHVDELLVALLDVDGLCLHGLGPAVELFFGLRESRLLFLDFVAPSLHVFVGFAAEL